VPSGSNRDVGAHAVPGVSPTLFSEARAWRAVGTGWRRLHGSFRDLGCSIEWHDFEARRDLDWASSFHPGGLEICLNLAGRGRVQAGPRHLELEAGTAGFYVQKQPCLRGVRQGGERHQFITVELSLPFLERHIPTNEKGLHPALSQVLTGRAEAAVSEPTGLSGEHQLLIGSLQRPPVQSAAQRIWYQAKALEVAAALLYQATGEAEMFCQRQQRLNRQRALQAAALLKENLVEPLSLEEIGRRIGCSHFYLSRIFSQEMGCGIAQFLRDLRLERAAELLRAGRHNVTEAAMEVGYSSLSHFSQAFRERFGCCPGLYPMRTPVQQSVLKPISRSK